MLTSAPANVVDICSEDRRDRYASFVTLGSEDTGRVKGSDRNFKAHRQRDKERQRKTKKDREKVGFIENTARRHRWGG